MNHKLTAIGLILTLGLLLTAGCIGEEEGEESILLQTFTRNMQTGNPWNPKTIYQSGKVVIEDEKLPTNSTEKPKINKTIKNLNTQQINEIKDTIRETGIMEKNCTPQQETGMPLGKQSTTVTIKLDGKEKVISDRTTTECKDELDKIYNKISTMLN